MCFLKLLIVLIISERERGRTSREERESENKKCDNIYSTRCFASDQDRVLKEPDVPLIQTEQ